MIYLRTISVDIFDNPRSVAFVWLSPISLLSPLLLSISHSFSAPFPLSFFSLFFQLDFESWGSGQPDNYLNGEDCGHLSSRDAGNWNDKPCDHKLGYICKKPRGLWAKNFCLINRAVIFFNIKRFNLFWKASMTLFPHPLRSFCQIHVWRPTHPPY